jgi:hypothetical protein
MMSSGLFQNTLGMLIKKQTLLVFDNTQWSLSLFNLGPHNVCFAVGEGLQKIQEKDSRVLLKSGFNFECLSPSGFTMLELSPMKDLSTTIRLTTGSRIPSALISSLRPAAIFMSDMSSEHYFDEDPLSAILSHADPVPVSLHPVPHAPEKAPKGLYNAWFSATGAACVGFRRVKLHPSNEDSNATELSKDTVPRSKWADLEYIGLVWCSSVGDKQHGILGDGHEP